MMVSMYDLDGMKAWGNTLVVTECTNTETAICLEPGDVEVIFTDCSTKNMPIPKTARYTMHDGFFHKA